MELIGSDFEGQVGMFMSLQHLTCSIYGYSLYDF